MLKNKTLVISISSDISLYLCNNVFKDHKLVGTYRNLSTQLNKIKNKIKLLKLDLSRLSTLKQFVKKNKKFLKNWNNCVISSGTQKPIGIFEELNSLELSKSIDINFKNQIILLNLLLPLRKKQGIKNVITWAVQAQIVLTSYIFLAISKIALIIHGVA